VRNRRRVVYYAILLLLILGELLGEINYIIIIFPEYDTPLSRTESGGMEVWIIDRNYTPFRSNVQRRRGMYLAMIERRLQ